MKDAIHSSYESSRFFFIMDHRFAVTSMNFDDVNILRIVERMERIVVKRGTIFVQRAVQNCASL